jgi:ATP-dependent exoDNAse (exonuclease V) beta subunit
LRLDQAYISTIHGFGLRILTEFAFEAGTSPKPRLLNDDEQSTLIRLALARTDKADDITSNLAAHGYSYDYNTKRSAGDVFRDDLLNIAQLMRSAGWRLESDAYATRAVAWIAERYGSTENGERLRDSLQRKVEALLRAYPESLERDYGTNATASDAFRNDFRNLHRALAGELDTDWRLWKDLRGLRQSKRGTPLPEDYDALAASVIAAADALPRHSGPRDQARDQVAALIAAGQEVLVHYAALKREAGLVDYVDMIAMAGRLLQEHPEVLKVLTGRVDCLVVDEFQDTNPLQFALLWHLQYAGVPTVVVGDLKQAIMGFQGADPRLFEALAHQHPEVSEPLTRNWRSQPRLMDFVNAIGPGLFGTDYVALEPQAADSPLSPLEVIAFPEKAKRDAHAVRAAAVGERLRALIEDPDQQIPDRRTKRPRRLRGGDIAVLCPTHGMLSTYAEKLRAQGLRVRLQAEGWFASRPVQIAWHALAYLADPADRHAAIYLAVTELGSLSLQDGLEQLMETGRIDEPVLRRLDDLAEGATERTIYALVADALHALQLFDIVARWPDAEQARANLLRLLAEAGEFMDANREALASGGYHGSGIQTFLAWLSAKVEKRDGDRQPDPRVLDEDAIVLVTWHAAKGREWPVVAVCGLDRPIKAALPNAELGYDSFADLSGLLEHARIEYAPKFSAPETNDRFLANLQAAAETEARRLLYVAFTRARDKLVMEWPGYLAGKDSTTYWSILTGACRVHLTAKGLEVGRVEFPCALFKGPAEFPDDLDLVAVVEEPELPAVGRRAIHRFAMPQVLTPDSRTTSQTEAPASERPALGGIVVERYGSGLDIDVSLSGTELGTFLHRCFEVLGPRPDLVERIPAIAHVEIDSGSLRRISDAVAQFETWLKGYFDCKAVLREWPLVALDEQGTVVSGTADLIVQTPAGVWVIDHKSDQVEDPVIAFAGYLPQLLDYAAALADEGRTLLGMGINWIRRGELSLARDSRFVSSQAGAAADPQAGR